MKHSIIIGATGLVGKELLQQLIRHPGCDHILLFVRRTTGIIDPKIHEVIVDFNQPATWRPLVKGDVLFSTLGTTIAQAGSNAAQYLVDYTYQYHFAQAAAANDVQKYVLVSSAGASPSSKIFYTRMKGELERDVSALPFQQVDILRPGLLVGKRAKGRIGETLGLPVLNFLNALGIAKEYKPVHASAVASAMLDAASSNHPGVHVHENLKLKT